MKTFTQNQKLTQASICDNDCIFKAYVISRTAKTLKIKMAGYSEVKTCRIKLDAEENEFIFPLGRYSMAPTFKAQ